MSTGSRSRQPKRSLLSAAPFPQKSRQVSLIRRWNQSYSLFWSCVHNLRVGTRGTAWMNTHIGSEFGAWECMRTRTLSMSRVCYYYHCCHTMACHWLREVRNGAGVMAEMWCLRWRCRWPYVQHSRPKAVRHPSAINTNAHTLR